MLIPEPRTCTTVPSSFRNLLLSAATDKGAVLTRVPKDGTISKIGLRVGTITQMTNPLRIGIQTVDATTGFPTGTAYGGMVAGTGTPVANTFTWYTLGTGATATAGNDIAIVADFNSFVAGDNINLNIGITRDTSGTTWPFVAAYQAGAWADQIYPANIALEYSDGSIVELTGITPYSSVTEDTFANTANPDRRGIKFKLPFPVTLAGAWALVRHDQDLEFDLYDSDGSTLLRSIAMDKDIRGTGVTQNLSALFSSAVTLAKDTYYYLVVRPTTASSIRMYYFDVTDDGANKAINAEPLGEYLHAVTANGTPTGLASWTATLTRRYHMGLVVSGFDDAAGGGVFINGRMTGGFING